MVSRACELYCGGSFINFTKISLFLYPIVVLVTKLRNASLSDKFVLFYPIFIHFQVQGIFVWMNSPEVVA